ncbi:hypothetical protein [Joostella sp.]|uniref:DUF7793 family protein n=1 Tax=Joostella sp. TaxID=2231138 RepID=UPI003A92A695
MRRVKYFEKAARTYLATEGSHLISFLVLLVDNPVATSISEVYLKINTPKVPTVACRTLEEGIALINDFLHKNN